MNINVAFSMQLIESARTDRRIVVVDSDVARSTKMREFGQAHPDSFFQVGIAEQNAAGISAGLASCGNVVFFVTFAPFATMRPFEIIRTSIAYPGQQVRIVGAYAALTDGKDGATHEALEDVGMMRTIPNMTIVTPSDANMARAIVRSSLSFKGPMYIRLENEELPTLYPEDFDFEIGKTYTLKFGTHITLAAYGTAVFRMVEAAKELEKHGVSAEVLDIASLKPFDEDTLLRSIKKTGRLITLEDHTIIGGLASIASELLGKKAICASIRSLAVPDVFGLSGTPNQLREYFNLTTNDVVNIAREMIEQGGGN